MSATSAGRPRRPTGTTRCEVAGVVGEHVGGLDQRGGDRVDGDAGLGDARGEVVGQAVQAGLGGGVVRADDAAGEGGDR